MKIPTSLLKQADGSKKNNGMAVLALLLMAIASIGGMLWGYTMFNPGKNQVTSLQEGVMRFGIDPCPGCGTG